MENTNRILQAGYHRLQVTPHMGYSIPGYYSKRYADGVITNLYMRATAFSDGENKAIIFSVDAIGMPDSGYQIVKKLIAERCNIDEDSIYIHCCHPHTAFRLPAPTTEDEATQTFLKWVFQRFADCAQFAFEDLKPCTLKVARGTAKNVGFVRIYRMKDGSCKTNPAYGDPDVVGPICDQDESVQLVRVIREGGKEILMVNFGTHADVIGGNKYCADWPGYLEDTLEAAFSGEVEAMTLVGPQGNSNHFDMSQPKGTPRKGVHIAKKMARVLAGEVLKIYDSAKDTHADGIQFCRKYAKVGKNPYDPADVPEAQKIRDLYLQLGTSADPIFKTFKLNVPEAVRIVNNLSRPEFFELGVSGLRIGGVTFIGFPGEAFMSIGTAVKENLPGDMTIVTTLTNGAQGYFPDAQAFAEKGYERSSSPFAHDCAQIMADTGIAVGKEVQSNL